VVVPPGVPDGAVVADGSGLAALTTATPPTANSPADRTMVAIVRRSPLGRDRRAVPAADGVVVGSWADMDVSFPVFLSVEGVMVDMGSLSSHRLTPDDSGRRAGSGARYVA
jgi:hypothetical protein